MSIYTILIDFDVLQEFYNFASKPSDTDITTQFCIKTLISSPCELTLTVLPGFFIFLQFMHKHYLIEPVPSQSFLELPGMKLMMDFYKQMQIEGNPKDRQENSTKWQPLSRETKHDKEHFDGLCLKKSTEKLNKGRRPHGSYIVGGSVSGCNFITFVNRKPPVYYGVTKESYRRVESSPPS